MVAAGTNPGIASSQLSSTANRVLIDYKDAIQDYKVTDMPVVQMFAERFTTDTAGDVDITCRITPIPSYRQITHSVAL